MKELLKLGVYTLLGTLFAKRPFRRIGNAIHTLGDRENLLDSTNRPVLIRRVPTRFVVESKQGAVPMDLRGYPPLSLLGLILLSYPYSIHPEPEKLLFIGQMVVLWYLLRQVFHEYPVLIGYFSMFFIATGLIEAIWGFRQLQGWAYSNHSLFRLTGSFSIQGLIPDIWRSHYRWLLASCWNSPNEICPITCPWDV